MVTETVAVPKLVELLDESTKSRHAVDRSGARELSEYRYVPDERTENILRLGQKDGLKTLRLWYEDVKNRLKKKRGVFLIPGPIQSLLGLPVRQVYIDKELDAIYRIEKDCRVTTRLL